MPEPSQAQPVLRAFLEQKRFHRLACWCTLHCGIVALVNTLATLVLVMLLRCHEGPLFIFQCFTSFKSKCCIFASVEGTLAHHAFSFHSFPWKMSSFAIHVMLVGFELLYLFLSQSEHKFILGYSCSASRAQRQVYGFALLVWYSASSMISQNDNCASLNSRSELLEARLVLTSVNYHRNA